jgi:hypothetical protein
MRKLSRSYVDLISVVVIIYFLYTIVYRAIFPLGQTARRFAFAELYLILPMAFAIFWVLLRLLWNRKKIPIPTENFFIESKTKLGGTRHIIFVVALALIFICILNFFSFLMRIV